MRWFRCPSCDFAHCTAICVYNRTHIIRRACVTLCTLCAVFCTYVARPVASHALSRDVHVCSVRAAYIRVQAVHIQRSATGSNCFLVSVYRYAVGSNSVITECLFLCVCLQVREALDRHTVANNAPIVSVDTRSGQGNTLRQRQSRTAT